MSPTPSIPPLPPELHDAVSSLTRAAVSYRSVLFLVAGEHREVFDLILKHEDLLHLADAVINGWQTALSHDLYATSRGVPRDEAEAGFVHDTEIGLRDSIALVRGEAEPMHGLGLIPRDAAAGVVHEAEIDLRVSIAPGPRRGCALVPPRRRSGTCSVTKASSLTGLKNTSLSKHYAC